MSPYEQDRVAAKLAREIRPPIVYREPDEDVRIFGGTRNLMRDAARAFNVDLTPEEYYDWQVEIGAAMLIDQLVDVEKRDVAPYFTSIVEGVIRPDLAWDIQVRTINYMARKSPARRAQLMHEVAEVNELVLAQREARFASEVIDIRVREAEIMARLFSLEVGDTADAQQRELFNTWVHGFSRTGYLFDTFIDAREDYENGESRVAPTIVNKSRYFTAFSKEGFQAVQKTPPNLIGRCALTGVNYVLRGMRRDVTRD